MLFVNSNSIVQLYAYGTNNHTIRVRLYHMRIRVRYVPYAYGMKYAYGTQHGQEKQPARRLPRVYYTRRDCVQKTDDKTDL